MKAPIRLAEAFTIMQQSYSEARPRPFRIVFCTCNRKEGTGGERILFERAVLPGKSKPDLPQASEKKTRGRTRSFLVKNLSSLEIRWVAPNLIEEINGHPVL